MLDGHDPYFFQYTSEPLAERETPEEELICWQAPSIAALGWIPLRPEASELPPYFRNNWHERLAVRMLLEAGNARPPEEFEAAGTFVQYTKRKDFRAALAIDEPKLYCEADGTPRRFTCWRGHEVGFTPVPGGLFDPMPGAGDECFTVSAVGDQVTLNYWMTFKLGKLADWAGAAMVRHRAPSAIVKVELAMRATGSAYVTCHSSFVPNQQFYVDWKEAGRYDMLCCEDPEFRGFIEAGKCKNAPLGRRFGM